MIGFNFRVFTIFFCFWCYLNVNGQRSIHDFYESTDSERARADDLLRRIEALRRQLWFNIGRQRKVLQNLLDFDAATSSLERLLSDGSQFKRDNLASASKVVTSYSTTFQRHIQFLKDAKLSAQLGFTTAVQWADSLIIRYYDFVKRLGISSVLSNGDGSDIYLQEKIWFELALDHQRDEEWGEAHSSFMAAWSAYNESQAKGMPHAIDETSLLSHLQVTAMKLNKIPEALSFCQLELLRRTAGEIVDDTSASSEQQSRSQKAIAVSDNSQMNNVKKLTEEIPAYKFCLTNSSGAPTNPIAYCRLDNRNSHPLLILSPVKEEFINTDPLVVYFHDIILPSEIEKLQLLAMAKFKAAEVYISNNNQNEVERETRNAEVAWIKDGGLASLTRRIEAYTGLNAQGMAAESYQVGRYQVGGHYSPHIDSFLDEGAGEEGDRIATLLIYLPDVEEGGRTIFTDIEIGVTPQYGSAIFWYNLHKNETTDLRTRHAACPVLRGQKWVVNKWFRFRGQHRHKPCGLSQTETFTSDNFFL